MIQILPHHGLGHYLWKWPIVANFVFLKVRWLWQPSWVVLIPVVNPKKVYILQFSLTFIQWFFRHFGNRHTHTQTQDKYYHLFLPFSSKWWKIWEQLRSMLYNVPLRGEGMSLTFPWSCESIHTINSDLYQKVTYSFVIVSYQGHPLRLCCPNIPISVHKTTYSITLNQFNLLTFQVLPAPFSCWEISRCTLSARQTKSVSRIKSCHITERRSKKNTNNQYNFQQASLKRSWCWSSRDGKCCRFIKQGQITGRGFSHL